MDSNKAASKTTTSSRLELLPPEIQAKMLRSLIGFKSLSALVHASPRLHRVYLTTIDREELWTKVTLNELSDRGVELFPPAPVVQVCGLPGNPPFQCFFVHLALSAVYGRVKDKNIIRLNHRDRQALCKIGNMVKWDVTDVGDGELEVHQLNHPHGNQNGLTKQWYWSPQKAGSGPYQTLVLGEYYGQQNDIVALVRTSIRIKRQMYTDDAEGRVKEEE